MHRHGHYRRRRHPSGQDTICIQRYFDPSTGRTTSILPSELIPYRPVQTVRLQHFFNLSSGIGSALDPPQMKLKRAAFAGPGNASPCDSTRFNGPSTS